MKGQGKKIISLFLICVMMLGVAGPGMEIFAGTTGASVENTEKTVAEAEHDKAAGTAGNNRSFGIGDVAEDSGTTEEGKTSYPLLPVQHSFQDPVYDPRTPALSFLFHLPAS